jgi:hypothetical protein
MASPKHIEYGRAMKRGRGIRGAAGALAGLAVLLGATALAPGAAMALDSDQKHAAAFKVDGSNGYSIVAFAASERVDGRGQIVLSVSRQDAGALYVAPATVTATRIEADLGGLGEVRLDVVPTGRKRTVATYCGEGPEPASFEAQSYRGSFEFHGEEGFTEAASAAPPEYTRFFFDLVCGGAGGGETSGLGLPGARLGLHARRGSSSLDLQAIKNRPGARTRLEVETREKRGHISILRSTTLWVGADAFDYDPLRKTGTLAPPAPFAGHGSFHRNALAAKRWSGNLTVDLPGRSDVALTGTGIAATLRPACLHEGETPFRC